MARYRLQEWLNFITSELHKSFSPLFNPAIGEDTRAVYRARILDRLTWVDGQLAGKSFLLGDTFTVADNAGGVGDNRNMLAMMQSLSQGILSGGTESINGAVSRFVGGIGVATNQAQVGAEAQQVILQDTRSAVDTVSGVNLDEEAANMLRYQQAYQAAAQVIRITQDMFDTLLRATQR